MQTVEASAFRFCDVLRPGDHIGWPQGTGEPCGLTRALMDQGPILEKMTLVVGMSTTSTLAHASMKCFKYLALNGAGGARHAVAESGGRVIPGHLSQLPEMFASGRIPLQVALIRVRPTDTSGVYSLGVMVDFVHEMVDAARIVIAEIDERMPLTAQDALIDGGKIIHFVTADQPNPIIPASKFGETDLLIARQVAELVPDRATLQFGVGGLPDAICGELSNHKDLGLHSGIITDAGANLMDLGVITNRYKGIDPGVTVTGGLFGTERLFDFADRNAAIEMRRATYTHAARVLMQIEGLYSINSAVAIDLTGQVNSEVAANRYIGAVGGQVDYVRGARLSNNGRSIIALGSITPDGEHSKIVAALKDQPVTTARSDVDLIVTEYGVADLWGRDMHARAAALIGIAHPAFRDQLTRDFEATLK